MNLLLGIITIRYYTSFVSWCIIFDIWKDMMIDLRELWRCHSMSLIWKAFLCTGSESSNEMASLFGVEMIVWMPCSNINLLYFICTIYINM